jgi:hypothetical protein
MKFRFVFWDVLPCKIIALMMEAARTSETSVGNYFTRQYIPEDKSELQTVFSSCTERATQGTSGTPANKCWPAPLVHNNEANVYSLAQSLQISLLKLLNITLKSLLDLLSYVCQYWEQNIFSVGKYFGFV